MDISKNDLKNLLLEHFWSFERKFDSKLDKHFSKQEKDNAQLETKVTKVISRLDTLETRVKKVEQPL